MASQSRKYRFRASSSYCMVLYQVGLSMPITAQAGVESGR